MLLLHKRNIHTELSADLSVLNLTQQQRKLIKISRVSISIIPIRVYGGTNTCLRMAVKVLSLFQASLVQVVGEKFKICQSR